MPEPNDTLDLWDYRRRVTELYASIRRMDGPEDGWRLWQEERDRLFGHHPQSALDAAQQVRFDGLSYFPYDEAWRFEVEVEPGEEGPLEIGHGAEGSTSVRGFGTVRMTHGGDDIALALYWLDSYGGGVFLPFRDSTNGGTTSDGGRYLLDTARGADLGHVGSKLVLDFNFAYHPSSVYNPAWSCPLAPPQNRLEMAVEAGEKLANS